MLAIFLISIIFYGFIVGVLIIVSCLFSGKYSGSFNISVAYSLFSE